MIVCNSKEERSNERKYVEMFKSNQVAGIILCSGTVSANEFLNLNIPIVTIECDDALGTAISSVTTIWEECLLQSILLNADVKKLCILVE